MFLTLCVRRQHYPYHGSGVRESFRTHFICVREMIRRTSALPAVNSSAACLIFLLHIPPGFFLYQLRSDTEDLFEGVRLVVEQPSLKCDIRHGLRRDRQYVTVKSDADGLYLVTIALIKDVGSLQYSVQLDHCYVLFLGDVIIYREIVGETILVVSDHICDHASLSVRYADELGIHDDMVGVFPGVTVAYK